jgi:hypothetical protein
MSQVSSVATSRVSAAIRSNTSSKPTHSKASTLRSRLSANTQLTQILEEQLCVDEYGFTDKTCKKCSMRLTIEEVMALVIPLDAN